MDGYSTILYILREDISYFSDFSGESGIRRRVYTTSKYKKLAESSVRNSLPISCKNILRIKHFVPGLQITCLAKHYSASSSFAPVPALFYAAFPAALSSFFHFFDALS